LLAPEIRIERVPVNDLSFHIAASQRLADSLVTGDSFLDPWVSLWALGFPLWHFYQPIPHMVAGLWLTMTSHFAPAPSAFAVLYYLLLVAVPACTYLGARLFGLSPLAAGFASILIIAVSEEGDFSRYGLSYGAYVRRGSGLYTQLMSFDLLVPALGLAARSLNTGRRRMLAACLVAATALSHVVFGYAVILSIAIMALVGPRRDRSRRVVRAASILIPAVILLAWFVVPMLLAGAEINRCRWDDVWKFDSWGAGIALKELFSGRFLDWDRWPVLTLSLLAASLLALYRWKRPMPRRLLVLTAAWLAIFFGRATWGYFMLALGLPGTFHISRFESVFELFAVLLTAWGLARIVSAAWRAGYAARLVSGIALGVVAIVIFTERANYLALNNLWGDESLAGIASEGGDVDAALADIRTILRERPGRVWAGPSGRWGGKFQIAKSQAYSFLSIAGLDEVSFLYHSLSWNSDVTAELDESDPYQANLFALRAVLAPVTQAMPAYCRRRAVHGRLAVYESSNEGYFGLVDIGARYDGPLSAVLNRDWGWMQNPAVRAGAVIALGGDIKGVPDWKMFEALPPLDPRFSTLRGEVISESKQGETYSARLAVLRPCYALLKITYFPGQNATVDGKPAPIFRVYPDFCAIPVGPGEHTVEVRYRPGPLKPILLLAGILAAGFIAQAIRRPDFAAMERRIAARLAELATPLANPRMRTAIALAVLTLLFTRALFRGYLLDGHDSLEYPPRLTEFARILSDHQFPPVWAPDLGSGHGQPLFEFAPPLIYAAALPFYKGGMSLADSCQFGLAMLFALGAIAVFLIGRKLSFSRTASIGAAAAWLFAPYQALDIYVCARFAESAALAVAPVALLGLIVALQGPTAISVALGALAVAMLPLAHNAIALLMFPAFAAIIAARSAISDHKLKTAAAGAGVIAGGLGLSAFFWLPALLERGFVKTDLLRTGFLNWSNYIIYPSQLFWSPWGFGYAARGPTNGISYSLGLVHIALAVAGLVIAIRAANRIRRLDAIVFAGAAIVAALLATDLSWAIWAHIATLQYLAYPWRTLCVPALFMPLLALYAFERMGPRMASVAIVVLVLFNIAHTEPKGVQTYDDAYFGADSIAHLGINTTTREEYEPRTVSQRPYFDNVLLKGVGSAPVVHQLAVTSDSQSFQVDASAPALMQDTLFDYPGWTVLVDDREVAVTPAQVSGEITFNLPAGTHHVQVELRPTPIRRWSFYLSIATAVLMISFVMFALVTARNRAEAVDSARPARAAKPRSRKRPRRPPSSKA
jgi:stage V sporulation protein SpoVS